MVSWFIDKNGRRWSPGERAVSYEKTQEVIEKGVIKSPAEIGCKRCKQKQGIIHYHNLTTATRLNSSNPYVSAVTRCCMRNGIPPKNAANMKRLLRPEHSGRRCMNRIFTFYGVITASHTRDMGPCFVKQVALNLPLNRSTWFEKPDFVWPADP